MLKIYRFVEGIFKFVEKHALLLALMIFAVVIVGGLVEIVPSFTQNVSASAETKPYSALQLAGRQVYIKEGCNNCHSQLIRPFKNETDRYGAFSKSEEYVYDRPFLWGSRRIGPDLHRVGRVRAAEWHELHFANAQATSPGSVMPDFTWFFENVIDPANVYGEMHTVKTVFKVPYDQPGMPTLGDYPTFLANLRSEATTLAEEFKNPEVKAKAEQGEILEVLAIVAYLNSLQ